MNSDEHSISENELQAYVDGQLDDERRIQVQRYLENNPDIAKRVEAYHQQNDFLQRLYGKTVSHDEEKFRNYLHHRVRQRAFPVIRVAAAIGLMLLGGVLGWLIHGSALESPIQSGGHEQAANDLRIMAQDAAFAHAVYEPEVLHPVEVDASQQQHLLKWLSKRLGKTIKTPDLTQQGFALLGGRLLPSQFGPAALFMYQNSAGQRMSLYVVVEQDKNKESAFRYFQSNNINVFYWSDDNLGFALSGEFSQSLLSQAANAVYHQLSL